MGRAGRAAQTSWKGCSGCLERPAGEGGVAQIDHDHVRHHCTSSCIAATLLHMVMLERILSKEQINRDSCFLWGPRQSGKSTLLRELLPEAS